LILKRQADKYIAIAAGASPDEPIINLAQPRTVFLHRFGYRTPEKRILEHIKNYYHNPAHREKLLQQKKYYHKYRDEVLARKRKYNQEKRDKYVHVLENIIKRTKIDYTRALRREYYYENREEY
jgi:hypothetical protein